MMAHFYVHTQNELQALYNRLRILSTDKLQLHMVRGYRLTVNALQVKLENIDTFNTNCTNSKKVCLT